MFKHSECTLIEFANAWYTVAFSRGTSEGSILLTLASVLTSTLNG